MRSRAVRLFLLAVLLSSIASAALADCAYWECRHGYDTAECWERFGPNATRFRYGNTCEPVASCITTYNEVFGWMFSCSYDCRVNNCYEV